MREFEPTVINAKLTNMATRLRRLNRYCNITLDEYLQDEDVQTIVERLLEQIIQSALDINRAFLRRVIVIKIEDSNALKNSETFILVGEYGLISENLGKEIAKSGGFRNVLAHLYDEILPEEVYKALILTLEKYPQYIQQVQNYLYSLETEDEET